MDQENNVDQVEATEEVEAVEATEEVEVEAETTEGVEAPAEEVAEEVTE